MTSVTTRAYDNSRSHANTAETVLTPQAVQTRGIRGLFSLSIPDDPRIEAQPLIVSKVVMSDQRVHNLCIVASMGGRVYCFDADTGETLWMQKIANPITGSRSIDAYLINPLWSCVSTPVIDTDTGTVYVCAWTSPDGSIAKAEFWLFALDIVDGTHAWPPIDLNGVSYQAPGAIPKVTFGQTARKQRCGLLMTNVAGVKTIFIGFGSVSESLNSARGWIIAVDVEDFKIATAWASTSRYSGAGIWQGGEGLASDPQGNIYCVTGNGAFDNVTDFGESIVKLSYTPATATAPAVIKPVDWFSPYTDSGRDDEPQNQALISDQGDDNPSNMNDWTDMDLGSAGALLIPELKLVVACGKDGIVYVLKTDNMGKSQLADMIQPAANYAKAAYIGWFTFFPGFDVTPTPDKFSDLNRTFFNATHHLHGTAVHWKSAKHGDMVFCQGENGPVRAWTIDATGKLTFLATGDQIASPDAARFQGGGMPGGMLTLSANGSAGGVLWALMPKGDANKYIVGGILIAYDADNFDVGADGQNHMRVLWRSDQWNWNFMFPKFNLPLVSNGKVYVPTYDGRVLVLGLA